MKKILVFVYLVLFLGTFVSAEYAAAADRFVNNNDGTFTDTGTGLMWADHDNWSDIDWTNAKSYCEGYSGGGKSGWRMPTINELAILHNSGVYGREIKITGVVWSSLTSGSEAAVFISSTGIRYWLRQSNLTSHHRALPVRDVKYII